LPISDALKPQTPVAIYNRYSSHKQESGMSIEMQMQAAQKIITEYELRLTNTYQDEKKPGYKTHFTRRKGMMELLKDARKGVFKAVITLCSDRVSRDVVQFISIIEILDQCGIQLIYSMPGMTQPFEQDIVSEMISYANAMHESERTSARVREAMKNKVDKGEWVGGSIPFGYQLNIKTGAIEILPLAAEIVKDVYQKYIRGFSFQSIAHSLAPGHSPTGRWTRWQIEGIIKNPFYAGYLTWNKRLDRSNSAWRNPADWMMVESKYIPKIIDKKTWDIAQGVLLRKKTNRISSKHYSSPNILKGLLYCSCGQMLLPKDNRSKDNRSKSILKSGTEKVYGNRIYKCPKKCLRLPADTIEEFVINDIKEIIATLPEDELLSKIEEKVKSEISDVILDIEMLEEQLVHLKNKAAKFKALSEEAKLEQDDSDQESKLACYNDIVMNTSKEIQQVKSIMQENKIFLRQKESLLTLKAGWLEKLVSIPMLWDQMSIEEKKVVTEELYRKIVVTPNKEVILDNKIFPQKSKKRNLFEGKLLWQYDSFIHTN